MGETLITSFIDRHIAARKLRKLGFWVTFVMICAAPSQTKCYWNNVRMITFHFTA